MIKSLLNKITAIRYAVLFFLINVITAFACLHGGMIEKVLTSDPKGYYQYLPQIFISGDMKHLPWSRLLENGNYLSLFHIGLAILELPFFLIGHLIAILFGLEANGYSDVYAWSITFGTIFYSTIGIYLLFKVLEKRFSKNIVLLTLTLIFLGTNFYYYNTHETAMSHTYTFFLFSGIIYFTERYYKNPNWKNALVIGILSGITLVIKPNNLIITLYFIFYDIKNLQDFKERVQFFLKRYGHVLLMLATIFAIAIPQLLYWNHVAGKYLLFSYGEGGHRFYWTNPKLLNVLVHPKNGWFLYSPIVIFAMIGLFWGAFKKQANFTLTIIIWSIAWYIFGSWECWWFGGAFGHRAFLEYIPLLAIPLAYFIQNAQSFKKAIKIPLIVLGIVFVFISIRMTFLYQWPWDGPEWGWDDYWNVMRRVFFS